MKNAQPIVDALAQVARAHMPAAEAARFEAEVVRMFKVRPRRAKEDREREQLLARHCPERLPPITAHIPTKPLPAKRVRRRHTWTKPKQLRLPF